MTPDFNAADSSTWPLVMTVEHMSAIYSQSVGGIDKACQLHKFIPAPFLTHPRRWRKADVVRHVEGARGAGLRRVS